MRVTRPVTFWIAALAVFVAVLALLHEILLPFVAGMALAYVLDPIVNRLERIGINRLAAALGIIGLYLIGFVVLMLYAAPILVGELAVFFENIPLYITRLQALVINPNRPWLGKIVGEGIGDAERSTGELATLGAGWLTESCGGIARRV